ncbi:hypothetical protein KYB31_12395 [Clostridium felsineum]|uniref:hypothetical protein n=1 Tax=Clostridium felsineum TaxID=36839 RepID=UPI00214DA08A|nr:hypothetical protein [Clostridium felsineum]MCR3759772.1 hypothetical protein [Clostridium felsineum]
MEKFLKNYSPSILFALIGVVDFAITSNINITENNIYIYSIVLYYLVPLVLSIYIGIVNCKRYLKMMLWQVLKYILVSFFIYILSIIVFLFVEIHIERMFHEVDTENAAGGILIIMVIIIYAISFFIAYLVPIIFKFIVYLKRIYDKKRIKNS